MAKGVAAEEIRAGLRHAVVCPKVTPLEQFRNALEKLIFMPKAHTIHEVSYEGRMLMFIFIQRRGSV